MAKKVYEESNIQAIADKIREKTSGDLTYKPSEMPNGIDAVYEAGKAIGGNTEEAFEAGKQAEYDRFWDSYQQNGNRQNHQFAFAGLGWNAETFKPKYPMIVNYAFEMFRGSGSIDCTIVDMDFSACTSFNNFARESGIIRFGTIDVRKASTPSYTFYDCEQLETIEKIILKDDGTTNIGNSTIFQGCNKLKNITFEGVIGTNLDMHWSSLLTHESLMSIIGALKPFVTYEEVVTDFPEADIYCAIVDAEPENGWQYDEWWEITSIYVSTNGVIVAVKNAEGYTWYAPLGCFIGVSATTLDEVPEYFKNATHYKAYSMEKGFSVKSVEAVPTGETKTLTLGETNLAKLTEAEKKIATDKGWILA